MARRDYDMERAIELGTAHGAIRGALMYVDLGMTDRAIAHLREALKEMDTNFANRQRAILGE